MHVAAAEGLRFPAGLVDSPGLGMGANMRGLVSGLVEGLDVCITETPLGGDLISIDCQALGLSPAFGPGFSPALGPALAPLNGVSELDIGA